jgi:CheY-like chemotaxis protein
VPNHKQRFCVLVVDDNKDVAESFTRLLRVLGCEAAFTTDPRNALSETLRLKPHVAFLDIGMPHLDGYQLARTLRAVFPSDELKLVAITAYASPEDHVASRKAGFDAHVVKPIDPALVESIMKTVLPEG